MAALRKKSRACAACNYQGKKCGDDCVLAQYFPADKPDNFAAVHRVFGVSNTKKMLNEVPPNHRQKTADSLIWEATAWKQDPIEGPRGLFNKAIAEYLKLIQQVENRGKQSIVSDSIYPTESRLQFGGEQRRGGGHLFLPVNFSNSGVGERRYEQIREDGEPIHPPAALVSNFVANSVQQEGGDIFKSDEVHRNYQQQWFSLNPNHTYNVYQGHYHENVMARPFPPLNPARNELVGPHVAPSAPAAPQPASFGLATLPSDPTPSIRPVAQSVRIWP